MNENYPTFDALIPYHIYNIVIIYVCVCVCVCNRMETQTWLSCHYKFISVENITILSVLSDDFLYAFTRSCRTANVELQFVFISSFVISLRRNKGLTIAIH